MKHLSLKAVPDKVMSRIGVDEALDLAKDAYGRVKLAQAELVAGLYLSLMLQEPRPVTYYRLKGMRTEARKQVANAQAVLAAIEECIEAMERTER
jgi:hypothetical protein